eukprot:187493-Pleurochrysis_carterae.AAC.1
MDLHATACLPPATLLMALQLSRTPPFDWVPPFAVHYYSILASNMYGFIADLGIQVVSQNQWLFGKGLLLAIITCFLFNP